MKMIFPSHTNKTHFHEKGALGLILKVRVFGTRKWPFFTFSSLSPMSSVTRLTWLAQRLQTHFDIFSSLIIFFRSNIYLPKHMASLKTVVIISRLFTSAVKT